MLPAFNMLAASILALAWLAIGLTFPILAVWFGVRVARDLRRIADSLGDVRAVSNRFSRELDELPAEHYDGSRPGVLNSMFAR